MSRFRLSIASCLLLATVATHGQELSPYLPAHLRGPWLTREVAFGPRNATIKLPDTWVLQEGGIAVSEGERDHCRIEFTIAPGTYAEALARELAADRVASRYAIHSELCCNSNTRIVSVRYASSAGKLLEKRHFELPSGEDGTLLTWVVTASSTREGNECIGRFDLIARSLRLTPNPGGNEAAPRN